MQTIENILVPIDFSDYSRKALQYAKEFALKFSAKMYLIYVFRPIFEDIEVGVINESIQFNNEIEEYAREKLQKLIQDIIGSDVPVEPVIRMGRPFMEINRAAEEYDIDLIIIATHGHTGVQHLLFGSTAEKVVRKAPCPVLSLREPVKGFRFDC
ncbi:MAG TPA: universal stress protein [Spirochaetota bacterium]|nr:universal stress protein [Spirochaetota bacterium]HQO01367.1 universal stress protein [Spirochaetota bacterium]HQP48877.1 universal stress protein [Spirochaetota bacterium]